MHETSNIFGHSVITVGGLGVSLNYPILNLKKTVCPETSGCGTVMHMEEDSIKVDIEVDKYLLTTTIKMLHECLFFQS